MSSTNRGGKRTPADNYPTPAWTTKRLFEQIDPDGRKYWGQQLLEPCAGEGAIIAAANEFYKGHFDRTGQDGPIWTSNELRKDAKIVLSRHVKPLNQNYRDYLDPDMTGWKGATEPALIISNPPFSIAHEVIQRSLRFHEAEVIMLLRLNFLASVKRSQFMRNFPPDVFVLPNRPDFKAHGKTDSIEYAWFRWPGEDRRRDAGQIFPLKTTPLAERRTNFIAILHPACAKEDHNIELDPKDGWCCIRPGCGFIQGEAA